MKSIQQVAPINDIELYVSITDYPNYAISNYGNVKNIITDKILKQYAGHRGHRGYKELSLCSNGKYKTFRIHRLLAKEFISNPNKYNIVYHINEIADDTIPQFRLRSGFKGGRLPPLLEVGIGVRGDKGGQLPPSFTN